MLSGTSIYTAAWVTASGVALVLALLTIVPRWLLERRLAKAHGARATVLAKGHVGSLAIAMYGCYMQSTNNLLAFYNWLLSYSSPESQNVAELTFGGHRILFTKDPGHIKTILTGKFAQFGKGPVFHDAWHPFLGDSIFTTDGHLWQNSRSLIRPMFTKDRIRDIDLFEHWADVFMKKLPPSGQPVDVCDLFYRWTLDVATDFLLGQSVGSMESPDSEFARAFMEVQRAQVIYTILAPIQWMIPKKRYLSDIKVIERFIEPFIHKTLQLSEDELQELSKSDRNFTFLHNIALRSRDPKLIRDQIFAVLIAGRDTTAATLSWALYELANAPLVWAKLRKEVLARLGTETTPSYEDIKEMKYLSNTLNEVLRLYPAVPYNVRTCLEDSWLSSDEGTPDIVTLKGDLIFYSTLAMQRRRDLYPAEKFADPAFFCPERWETWQPKPWHYVPFNGGPRICIGQNFALTEMALMLVRLVQRYERVEYRGDWHGQFHKVDIVSCPGKGVPVAFFESGEE